MFLAREDIMTGDHPRVCGEKCMARLPLHRTAGITPACAGKRHIVFLRLVCYKDHPRVCGEKDMFSHDARRQIGSPPRVRGKGNGFVARTENVRITPACAGKSLGAAACFNLERDHPRVCGEKAILQMCGGCRLGSPPRVRGKVGSCHGVPPVMRITPACAGKSLTSRSSRSQSKDHPRVCGEKTKESLKK